MEEWKVIYGFSKYEASNYGRLRSLNYKKTGKVKVLKPAITPDGYLKTMIMDDDGKYRSWTVHRFVCLAFLGPKPDKKYQCNHIDGVKTNNLINNLEYCTASENVKHAYDIGLGVPMVGSTNGQSKLKERDVIEIRNYVSNFKGRFYGRKALAEKYGICESHVKDLVARRRGIWGHI